MKKSLHFGLNAVLPAAYGGWQGWLRNPVNDARDTAGFYMRAGFLARAVFNLDCTVERLRTELASEASSLGPGDTFLFYYSGHGGQYKSEALSGYKETLCLADGEIVDTALRELFSAFKAGVRVVFISDSCHAGGLARATMPPSRDKPNHVRSSVSLPLADEILISSSNMLVAASTANELSSDGEGDNGAFTAALLQVGDDFERKETILTWDNHVESIQSYMAMEFPTQHPEAERYGAPADWNVEVASSTEPRIPGIG